MSSKKMQKSQKNLVFSKNLKYLRNKEGISQVEFAKKIGVSNGAIGNYETGMEPAKKVLKLMSELFNVSTHDLLYTPLETVQQVLETVKKDDKLIPVVKRISANPNGYEERDIIAWEPESGIIDMFYYEMNDNYLWDGSSKSIKAGDKLLVDPDRKDFYPGDLVVVITTTGRQWVRFVEEIQEETIKLQGNLLLKKEDFAAMYRVVKVRPADFDI